MELSDPMIQLGLAALALFAVCFGAVTLGLRVGLSSRLRQLERKVQEVESAVQRLADEPEPEERKIKNEGKLVRKLAQRLAENKGSAPSRGEEADVDLDALEATLGNLQPISRKARDPQSKLEIMREALKNDRVDLALQPVVSLPQRQRRFYEGYARLRSSEGEFLVPADFLPLAEEVGEMSVIDNMALLRTIQLIRKVQRGQRQDSFFCNVSTHTLCDIEFITDFVEYIAHNKDLASQLIFEFAASELDRHPLEVRILLDRLSDYGCRFSIDGADPHKIDLERLQSRGISFVKIDAVELLNPISEGFAPAERLCGLLKKNKIHLIATHVEEEEQAVQLVEFAVPWGQGYLFGEPRTAREAA